MSQEYFAAWALVTHQTLGQVGYQSSSSTAFNRIVMGHAGDYRASLPRGVMIRGFREYLKVEKALDNLPDAYRLLLALDQGLIRPAKVELRTVKQRADLLGISVSRYYQIMARIKQELNDSRSISG